MQRILISVALIVVMFGFSLLLFGCNTTADSTTVVTPNESEGPPPWAPAHGYRAKHHYYYYPDHRVYYEPAKSMYYYLTGDGWRFSTSLPSGITIGTGNYVTLDMDSDRPYAYHNEVVKRYPPGQGRGNGHNNNHGNNHNNNHGNDD